MLRRSLVDLHRGGRSRAFVHKDPSLINGTSAMSSRSLNRIGVNSRSTRGFKKVGFNGQSQYDHAFPLLSHDELGHSDQSNDTNHVLLANYMPKRNKGTAPWFRGADTYSVKYSEQGRYEYQRYLMISRYPSMYKREFERFLRFIRYPGLPCSLALAQESLHWLQRMIVDNFNPQHVHYIATMETLMIRKEYDMARDVWLIMERQQTWPCDRTIATYLNLCILARQKTWAFECWNRYCTEKKFLAEGEIDPKPITRIPFSLNRDELLYLPKWKKHFDHDPNNDVIDLNRFNTTRVIYSKMALTMLVCGEWDLFESFFSKLEEALLSTPTPVPEPPAPLFKPVPRWAPHEATSTLKAGDWRLDNTERVNALGPTVTDGSHICSRFYSNRQFLLHTIANCINAMVTATELVTAQEAMNMSTKMFECVKKKLLVDFDSMNKEELITALLAMHRERGGKTGMELYAMCESLNTEKDGTKAQVTSAMRLEVLKGFAKEASEGALNGVGDTFRPQKLMQQLITVVTEIAQDHHAVWGADMHLAVVQSMVYCGTMTANNYFVKNVLRKFEWGSEFLEVLYLEYRRAPDIDTWAELTKRALVWTARYNVVVSETLKELIEKDYAFIKVQVRSYTELAVFQFRDVEEKRHSLDPVNALPNPWMDYVSHALPFPDRDTGYPNEYGEIGQWRAPYDVIKGPGYYSPPMGLEYAKGYTSEWRDPKNPMKPPALPKPWEDKYQQYARGSHPSYDMTYAGPMPEVFPHRKVFRPKTRWDQFDIQKQSKYKIQGPY